MKVSVDNFAKCLQNNQQVRGLQILQAAMMMGVATFAIVIAVFYFMRTGEPAVNNDQQILYILSAAHLIIFFSCFVGGMVIGKIIFNPTNLSKTISLEDENVVEVTKKCLGIVQKKQIIVLALAEGPALFGIVICLIAVNSGAIKQQPALWANLATTFIFIVHAVITFPTTNYLKKIYKHDIKESMEMAHL